MEVFSISIEEGIIPKRGNSEDFSLEVSRRHLKSAVSRLNI
jgi:hypothetical protein